VKLSLANAMWSLAYLAVMAAVIGAILKVRSDVLATYGTPSAQTDWDDWRAEAKQMEGGKGPVKRRQPKSAEPPALVLMRDHFAVCLGGALLLTSVLFGTFMMLVRGALAANPSPPTPLQQGERGEGIRSPTPDSRPPAP
jgi:hypothetical protein